MEFMKLIGTVLAVCFHPSCASSAFGEHRICRRGTEKPCYKITSFQDSRLRASFEAAREKCREDDGELLSIETENEQRLVERIVQELRASDGDFWIGLRRSPQYNVDCSAQYYWLDYSQATFRNWLVTEPSCGLDQCVALFYRPSSSAVQKKRNLFKWMDYNCNSKNNFICKYSDEKHPVPTPAGNITTHTVSISDDTINIYYILLAILPVMLLLILVVSGVFCFRVMSRRRKEQNEIYAVPGQWVRPVAPKSQNSYEHANKFNQPGAHLEYMSSEIDRTFSVTSTNSQFEDYENVPSRPTRCGFVTNDIYETCRSPSAGEAGWVDNDIYGY
ncbi:layilin isoform X3 [Rhinichthys klamathensis goyatoka]|uniref:layilin isoform X3 n=1 Tax=Rhinichthys klamathensis goyatoka TaxID=3034132 RepID=UPI0024B54481|nr:layilin isoform X3 [Rhinichthys klamathensis goyatoka]